MNLFGKIGDIVTGKGLQITFKDRQSAGNILATTLKATLKDKKESKVLVLGIPRGGVIIADIIASKLNADFDIVLPRKLRASDSKENAVGAIMADGSIYLDDFMVQSLKVSQEYIKQEKQEQLQEIERRTILYRLDNKNKGNIKDKTVILVDDGIASGATIIVAARWIKTQQPKKLIIAAPVANKLAIELLRKEADYIETIITSSSTFISISQFYQKFEEVTDKQVIEFLDKWYH
jgi:predicted phosphoribosyltransferase